MGKYEVRVSEFREFIKATGYKTEAERTGGAFIREKEKWEKKEGIYWGNPGFSQNDNHPVTCVSWNDAMEFCKWLTIKTGHFYRLPTEAEWEYACRAGTQKAFSFGTEVKALGAYAWYRDNAGGQTHPVGQKEPNAWGLYDMHGNVREICQDWYGDYSTGSVVDPVGPDSGQDRVWRGGTWGATPTDCRCGERSRGRHANANFRLGFRLGMNNF
jgi:formylglycine-generating enzyme required for sulfatase activity